MGVVVITAKRRLLSSLILGLGFSLTGAGTIALGVLLPVISAKWGLRDDQAGLLFFLQFLGSCLGAIFTNRERIRSLTIGYALLVAGSCALAFVGAQSLYPVFFIFGLGLGLTMTATNLLVSDRAGNDRAAQLERFNFAWSAGAMVAPLLLIPFLHGVDLRILYFIFAGLFLLLFVWVAANENETTATNTVPAELPAQNFSMIMSLVPLLILAVCSIGVETALSGWLTTYSRRASPLALGGGAIATTLFMFGIVFSRFAASTRLLAWVGRLQMLRLAMWGSAAAVGLLIFSHHWLAIDLASVLAGFSVGPMFPLLLAYLLERSPRGWVLAVSGLGSVIFPWVTGLLSERFGSLRYGLLAPLGAAALMIAVIAVKGSNMERENHPRTVSV